LLPFLFPESNLTGKKAENESPPRSRFWKRRNGMNREFSYETGITLKKLEKLGEGNLENGQFYMISSEIWILQIRVETESQVSDRVEHEG
jgi:hypothetical protein